jgi:hypothetical protein
MLKHYQYRHPRPQKSADAHFIKSLQHTGNSIANSKPPSLPCRSPECRFFDRRNLDYAQVLVRNLLVTIFFDGNFPQAR